MRLSIPRYRYDYLSLLIVYLFASVVVWLIIIPLSPFAHRLPTLFYVALALIGVISTVYCAFIFPFSSDATFKAYFWQTIDLDSSNSTVALVGVKPGLRQIISNIPSADEKNTVWNLTVYPGLAAVSYSGPKPNSVPNIPLQHWLNITFETVGNSSTVAHITARDTRACRLQFENRPFNVIVLESGGSLDDRTSEEPIKRLDLWSRTWDGEWKVDVKGVASGELKGRVSCIWSEYLKGRIPALEEVSEHLPPWAALTALRGGLVEGSKSFSA